MAGHIVVGTSSWAAPGLAEKWYPSGLPEPMWLPWYARHFVAVEGDPFFTGFPSVQEVDRWAHVTPPGFTFSLKLPRVLGRHPATVAELPPDMRVGARVTRHGRVLLEPSLEQELVRCLLETVEPLRASGKLSAFVLPLAPAFDPRSHSLLELRSTIDLLRPHPVAVEFAHPGWVDDDRREETLGLLEDMHSPMVCTHADAVTHPALAYVRADVAAGREEELQALADRAARLAADAEEVRVIFDDDQGHAPSTAGRFRELVRGRALAAA